MLYEQAYGKVYYVAYGDIFAAELFLIMIFLVIFLPRKRYFAFRAFLSSVGYFFFAALAWYGIINLPEQMPYMNLLFYTFCTVMLMLVVFICFKTSLFGSICFATAAYAVQHSAYSLGNIIQYSFEITVPNWAHIVLFDFLIYFLVGSLIFWIFIFPRRKKFDSDIFDVRAFFVAIVTLVICMLLSLLVDNKFAEYFDRGVDVRLMRIYCSTYALISCITSLIIQFSFLRENLLTDEKLILNQLISSEKKRHEMSKETVEMINRKCHDLKNQVAVLERMDDTKSRREYIDELKSNIDIFDTYAETGNDALDIVISEKGLLCNKYDISFSYLVDGEKLSFMSVSDIAAMFSNALDNAIERQLKESPEKRFISLSVKDDAGFIHIHMDNCCTEQLVFVDGLPQSDKADSLNHGFGTKSISSIAAKYLGDVFMCVEDDRFNLDILFPITAQ